MPRIKSLQKSDTVTRKFNMKDLNNFGSLINELNTKMNKINFTFIRCEVVTNPTSKEFVVLAKYYDNGVEFE